MAFNSADTAAFKNVWVFCEQRQGKMMPTTYELISEGRKLADELGVELCGVLLGDNVDGIAKELGGYGADKVYVYNSPLLTIRRHGYIARRFPESLRRSLQYSPGRARRGSRAGQRALLYCAPYPRAF